MKWQNVADSIAQNDFVIQTNNYKHQIIRDNEL